MAITSNFNDTVAKECVHIKKNNQNLVCLLFLESNVENAYCRMPEGWGLQQTASPPSREETRSVNPLVRAYRMVLQGGKLMVFAYWQIQGYIIWLPGGNNFSIDKKKIIKCIPQVRD